jgi:phage baseplate assembly protein W
MRTGLDASTGQVLTGWDHCVQSIGIILTTRVGSRVMRRSFGSGLRDLQDRNPDPRTMIEIFGAIAQALRTHEPGFRLRRITPLKVGDDGVAEFDLSGTFYPYGHLGDYSTSEERNVRFGERAGFREVAA